LHLLNRGLRSPFLLLPLLSTLSGFDMNLSFILLIASGLLSFAFVFAIKHYFSAHLMDLPNHRSSHSRPTPRGGGLGFVAAFVLISSVACLVNLHSPEAFGAFDLKPAYVLQVWSILLPLAIVGLVDDRKDVPASVRYLVQLAVAGVAVFYFGAFPQPWLEQWGIMGAAIAVILSVIGITAGINFYNFMDGLDGLVAGVTAVQLGYFALTTGQPLFGLLVAALVGFLYWNWSPAKIFMGDVGSTVLGGAVAIALLNQSVGVAQSWANLAITLPLMADAIYTLVRRLQRHENIFKPHRSHIYQRLNQLGWSHSQVANSYIIVTIAIASSVYYLGAIGAFISVLGTVLAISLAEFYLAGFTIRITRSRRVAENQNG
jgi:Fuc2NAc and GlcNAc transferase